MTLYDFISACEMRTIDPAIALENTNLRKALATEQYERVIEILDTEF